MSVGRIPFTEADEQMVRSLAGWMTFMAVVHIVVGVIGIVAGGCVALGGAAATARIGAAGALLFVLVALLVAIFGTVLGQGVLLLGARASFRELANTDDADQEHLSHAFRKVSTFFLLEVLVGGLGFLGAAFTLVMLFVSGRGGAS